MFSHLDHTTYGLDSQGSLFSID